MRMNMKEDLFYSFVVHQIRSTQQRLSRYQESGDPEHLHDMRVRIKKIKALFSFLAFVYEKRFSTTDLKKLFRKAGKLRDIQLHIRALILLPHPPFTLIESLCKKEHRLEKHFQKSTPDYLNQLQHFEKRLEIPDMLPESGKIMAYFNKQKQKASAKCSNKVREDIHHYRRIVKNMMYVYSALPKSMQQDIDFNAKEVNHLQEKLGNWHDTYALIHFLSKKKFHLQEQNYMSALITKEQKEFNALFKGNQPFV